MIIRLLKKIKGFVLDILFPIECLGCGKDGMWLCDKCVDGFEYIKEERCVVCKQKGEFGKTHKGCRDKIYLDGLMVCCEAKDGLLQDVIRKFKYNFIQDLSLGLGRVLTNKVVLAKQMGNRFLLQGDFRVIAVPLHKRRLNWRGFNQAVLLAERLANFFDWRIRNDLLVRAKYTKPQVKFKKKKRGRSIEGAFEVRREISGDVLLIDDILTTGATLGECARILKEKGAHRVWAMVLSRG